MNRYPLLKVENLCMMYDQPGEDLVVLSNLSFQVNQGEFLCLVGPSGYGKTTLLHLIAGLECPQEGHIYLEGEEVRQPRRDVGIVFQEPTLMDWRTVQENIALPLQVAGQSKTDARRQAREYLDLVGLTGFEDYYPAQLSGGMAQRVALARALVHRPKILLLDEPFGALDALTRERMGRELLRVWQARRKTVVMVTHSVTESVFLADRVLVLGQRPATIKDEVIVDIPRPRTLAAMESTRFNTLTHQVRKGLSLAEV